MTRSSFNNLSLTNKSNFLWSEGEHLFTRVEHGYLIKLYALYGFFVEVKYSPPDMHIEKITVLDSNQYLEKYLSDINLPQIL